MPSYDYTCDACGHSFEEFQSMSDPVLTDCPACKTPKLRRLIGGGLGVIFKGSGFYVNDSKSTLKSGTSGSNKKTDDLPAASTETPAAGVGPAAGADSAGSSGTKETASAAV